MGVDCTHAAPSVTTVGLVTSALDGRSRAYVIGLQVRERSDFIQLYSFAKLYENLHARVVMLEVMRVFSILYQYGVRWLRFWIK